MDDKAFRLVSLLEMCCISLLVDIIPGLNGGLNYFIAEDSVSNTVPCSNLFSVPEEIKLLHPVI